MNKKYIYIAIAIVVVVIVALSLNKKPDVQDNPGKENVANSPKPTNTSGNNAVSVKPKPESGVDLPKFITVASLKGSIYRLKSYNGTPVPSDARYTLSFEENSLSAKFCNSINGPFVLDGGKITANNLISTKMFCTTPAGVMDLETQFGSILNFGANIYQSGNDIVISSKDSVFVFTGFGN
jgi:heat shock protein HslJ